ncbi:MAG: nuclear transport factor 2 family protein [Acidimicrobiaceae bacterium]|jgi:hypothetical protein|nr:nuclear transport factor 2 family protein [Acidimicrobiaceae bacterium]MBT5581660.1 nuclear transport factor 2 family protein [Acidimicrobiaceae bacterium]MBT5849906.1 nuclear transport factor 2 family protein [Acidimicrobiaceae bacterium]
MSDPPDNPVVRLWRTIWLGDPADGLDDILSDPYIRHTRDGTASVTIREYVEHMRQATRNVRGTDLRVDQSVEMADRTFIRVTLMGVNITSGDPVMITVVGEYRLNEGRIAESWSMHQSGLDWR